MDFQSILGNKSAYVPGNVHAIYHKLHHNGDDSCNACSADTERLFQGVPLKTTLRSLVRDISALPGGGIPKKSAINFFNKTDCIAYLLYQCADARPTLLRWAADQTKNQEHAELIAELLNLFRCWSYPKHQLAFTPFTPTSLPFMGGGRPSKRRIDTYLWKESYLAGFQLPLRCPSSFQPVGPAEEEYTEPYVADEMDGAPLPLIDQCKVPHVDDAMLEDLEFFWPDEVHEVHWTESLFLL